jgi:hypothetical protein
MRTRGSIILTVAALMLAACSDDGGESSLVTSATSGASGSTTPAPVEGPLTMPADSASLVQPDPATGLAQLGFPQGWVLPDEGADIVGVLVRYSQGDSTYATFRTAYRVSATDPEAVLKDWSQRFSDGLGIAVDPFPVQVSGDLGESWSMSTAGDAEAGKPALEVQVVQPAAVGAALQVIVEYQTVDRPFPEVIYPTTVDPALPSFDACTVSRIDVDLDGVVDITMAATPPVYRLWWEGSCPAATFDGALAWAQAHSFDVGAGTTGFGQKATLADGTTVELNANKGDTGKVFLSVVTERPIS